MPEIANTGAAARAVSAWLPIGPALGLLTVAQTAFFQSPPSALYWSSVGGALGIAVWTVWLVARARSAPRPFRLETAVRPQHYVQACAQATVFAYWTAYWPQAPAFIPLLTAQLLFAYALDLLLAWSARDVYSLGFGPWPVVFSINLFLVFKEDRFYWQFAVVALAFLAKRFVRWHRDGRLTHVFNPSAVALAVASIALLATGTSGSTLGQEIAVTQFYPPQMYLVLFLVGLPGQLLFGVTSMTMAAVVSTWLFGLVYFWTTGVYFFYDSYVPIAVFLGMHLLFTDPSTSPRTELGRLVFGALYGLGTIALYSLLSAAGVPTFYDKLFPVPLLNLSISALDRISRLGIFRAVDPARIGRAVQGRQRHLAYVAVWTLVFFMMSATQGAGDRHPGQWIPFWRAACAQDRPRACAFLQTRLSTHCAEGSGWACNEVGIRTSRVTQSERSEPPPASAAASFERGCALGFQAACGNLRSLVDGRPPIGSSEPTLADYAIVLRGSKRAIEESAPEALLRTACQQGWPNSCEQGR